MLSAVQDIAVDGLALTVLSERNKELGATCNAIGQTLGYFLAYVSTSTLPYNYNTSYYGRCDLLRLDRIVFEVIHAALPYGNRYIRLDRRSDTSSHT